MDVSFAWLVPVFPRVPNSLDAWVTVSLLILLIVNYGFHVLFDSLEINGRVIANIQVAQNNSALLFNSLLRNI